MLTKNIWEKQENCVIKYSLSLSLHGTALWEDQSYPIFVSKMQGSWFAESICLYANRLNINTEGIKLSSVFLTTQKRSGKKTLFAMTYILFRYCFLFPSSYFHPKPQWILNHGPWMVVFIKTNQGSFILLFLSLSRKEGRKLGGSAETYQGFYFTQYLSSFPSPSLSKFNQLTSSTDLYTWVSLYLG